MTSFIFISAICSYTFPWILIGKLFEIGTFLFLIAYLNGTSWMRVALNGTYIKICESFQTLIFDFVSELKVKFSIISLLITIYLEWLIVAKSLVFCQRKLWWSACWQYVICNHKPFLSSQSASPCRSRY